MNGHANGAFANDDSGQQVIYSKDGVAVNVQIGEKSPKDPTDELPPPAKRDQWGNDWEFLMSCISLSVGLGNVWRFPFTALDNGGGAFLIPYLIVLFVVGKPVYYLEMLIGQFSSRGSIKVFDFAPAMRGIGVGQVWITGLVTAYYSSLLALTIRFLISSMNSVLPWSECQEEWKEQGCIDSVITNRTGLANATIDGQRLQTSAEMYFYRVVLKETANIDAGIGLPDWRLVLCLAFAWLCITLVLLRGIRSSGKASYFLAIFPYIIMGVLFVRAVSLPGSAAGILYFLTPQFDQLLNPSVWYAAVSQVFFSLAICLGNIIMYSSFNRFTQKVYRDTLVVTSLDTCTSLIAGIIIFGILGNLAHVTGADSIRDVVQGGTGLAFSSYPDAIAKFEFAPQVFAGVFFFMLFVLGIGTNVGMSSCLMTALRDRFGWLAHWQCAVAIAVVQFSIGLLYVTPGGQFLIQFVDFYGASFVAFILAIAELVAFGWIYGVSRLCRDVEFMLGIKTGLYWRLCWGLLTPGLMAVILVYNLATLQPLTYNKTTYPAVAHGLGWCLAAFGILQLPLWAMYTIRKQKGSSWRERVVAAFRPTADWGPADPQLFKEYQHQVGERERQQREAPRRSLWTKFRQNLFD